MKSILTTMMLAFSLLIALYAHAASVGSDHEDSVGYYFNYSNELIDLPYPGSTFYASIELQCLEANHLDICFNPFSWPGENDCMGNYVKSPLVAGSNFGVQKIAMDSSFLTSRTDFDNFISLYDILLPDRWKYVFNGQVSEFGRFEFLNMAPSNREDPLIIHISPKPGMDLTGTGYEFNTVFAFVEPNAEGYCFAAHIADFTVDPAYWENGSSNPNSAYFAVGECAEGDLPVITPEPSCIVLIVLGAVWTFMRKKR